MVRIAGRDGAAARCWWWSAGAAFRVGAPGVALGARLVVGVVLVYAGLQKVASPALAVLAVRAYEILPGGLATVVGYGQPVLEIALGVLLIVGLGTRMVAVITGVLFVVFIGGAASVWARGLFIDCGCFGGGGKVAVGQTRYPLEILRDAGLLALTVLVVVWPPGVLAVDRLLGVVPRVPGRGVAGLRDGGNRAARGMGRG
jgi:uncharacterized membrane protein YphA (DoxX/SURF4 family)